MSPSKECDVKLDTRLCSPAYRATAYPRDTLEHFREEYLLSDKKKRIQTLADRSRKHDDSEKNGTLNFDVVTILLKFR